MKNNIKVKTIIIALVCYLIDLATKVAVTKPLLVYYDYSVIKNFFSICYLRNYGGGLGILSNQTTVITIITLIVVVAFFKIVFPTIKTKLEMWGYGILIGGVFGNFIERIVNGYVTDFISLILFKRSMPVFNIADVCICVGVGIIIFSAIRSDKNENNNRRKRQQKDRCISDRTVGDDKKQDSKTNSRRKNKSGKQTS